MRLTLSILAATLCVAACGTKGPLFLPPPVAAQPAPVKADDSKAPATAPAPKNVNP